tara:strand:- start:424 stop:1200 length:777 start_codon:yes stop_codon:yes gene_type:complete
LFIFEIFTVFFIGLIFGSFANVCIARLPKDKTVIFGRSNCPTCKKKICWYDNIPLISFILLGGKCRQCNKKISVNYFFVELISGIFFILIYLYTNNYFEFFLINLILFLFLIIFFIDLKHFIIPDILNFSLIFLGLLKNFIPIKNLNFNYDIEQSIIGGVVGYLTIWIIIFVYKKLKNLDAMGLGDAKLMAAIGTFFGLKSIPLILFLSSIIALLIVLPSLINKTRKLKAEIPFGPYILISAGFYYFYGDKIYEILLI